MCELGGCWMIGFIFFAAFFVSFCGVCNFYILWRFTHFFGVKRRKWFWVALAVITLSYVLGVLLDEAFGNSLTGLIHSLAALWLGVGLLLICALLLFEIVNLFVKVPPRVAGIVIGVVVLCVTVYSMVNARQLIVTTIDIEAPVEMDIVQLSDIHLGSDGDVLLNRIVAKTNELYPDVVLVTGDIVDPHSGFDADDLKPFNDLNADVFFVTGNHDGYAGVENVIDLLGGTKVRTLRNEAVDFGEIQIVGIDDDSSTSQVSDQLKSISVDESKYSVLMYHRPEGFEDAVGAGIDLMLCGHTHNGQIFPFNFVVGLAFKYVRGLFEHGGSYLYVTTGTSTWGPKMRLGSKNEIVLFRLRKKP